MRARCPAAAGRHVDQFVDRQRRRLQFLRPPVRMRLERDRPRPDRGGYGDAMGEWDEVHAQPLLPRTVPAAIRELVREAKQSVNQLSEERPLAALAALEDLAVWADAVIVRLGGANRVVPKRLSLKDRPRRLRLAPG